MTAPHPAEALSSQDRLLELAPSDLPNFRSVRYSGGGLGVPMDHLAPDDQMLVRRVYNAVIAVATTRSDGPCWSPAPEFVAAVRAVGEEAFIRAVQRLGSATIAAGAGLLVRKVLHDIRGDGLTALVGTAGLITLGVADHDLLLLTCGRLARDHCKIMRSALSDLDPRRTHDEQLNCHGVEEFVRTWDGVTVCEYGREVTVAVNCAYRGGVAASCLENAAVDRVLYNHINNAARFAVDGRVTLSIFGVGDRLIRWEHYPDEAELLFRAAGYARDGGDPGGTERLHRALTGGSEGPHFASVGTGVRAVKRRHNLAVLLDQNRLPEAEGLWRAALTHDPHFLPAQVGLGEVAVAADNRAALERQAGEPEGAGEAGAAEAAVLRARWRTKRGEHPAAAALLEAAAERYPGALGVRVALSHTRIAADAPPDLLEAAFRGVLALDPGNEQAKRNLAVLYRKTGRHIEGVIDTPARPHE